MAGKVALITGGGTGIGQACARLFAREGAKVAICGRRRDLLEATAKEIRAAAGEALAIACDVTKAGDVERAVQETVARNGWLNVLVNNAGTMSVTTAEQITEEEWDRLMEVNLKGPWLVSRTVLPEFRKAGGGAIVNIGSVLGLVAMKSRTAYCASKGGVTMLTKAMALDHAHEKIRVNCICPSVVETEMVSSIFERAPDPEALRQTRIGQIPMGRLGKPEDVAQMAVFLASEESAWVTGAAIALDGGLTAY